ncbi:MAG TPA: peroxiredoxin [Candidatus Limnocylindria bacterium]|nr:peroxiredoxin [Candidatus Limnocylindria bacterium]
MEMFSPNMPGVGDAAPDLTLPDDTGTQRDLAERRGHWTVLYFYPKDDTPGCTTEACEFRDINSSINAHDAEVWGVSVLGSGSKAAFKAKFGLNFVLLADADHAVAERYGTWVEKVNYGRTFMGVQRATFLVDPDGRIAHAWPKVKAQGHAAEVLATLDAARAERTGAQVA